MDSLIGKLIAGRFRIESVIGSGGIGTVYRAIQEPLERPVAVKMLRQEFSESQDLRRRFVREARAVAALSHPNIAMVHDFGVGRDRLLFMAMEFVEGRPLTEVLDAPDLDFNSIVGLFDQILTGLAHAHARGIIHRDIKPANILVAHQEDGTPLVKIVDFGIAVVGGFNWSDDDEAGTTGQGQVIGTPQYMAPEQARGERHVSATVDVYAVGLMLYRAVTGHDAFDGDNPMDILVAQVREPPPPITVREGLDIPVDLRRVILDALAKSPRERIPSAGVFRSRLRRLVGQQTNPALPRPPQRNPRLTAENRTVVEDAPTVDFAHKAPMTALEDAVAEPVPSGAPPAASLRGETPFVGREDDVARVVAVVADAIADQTGIVVVIEGEAGMGKTRVAASVRQALAEHSGYATGHGAFHREGERGLRGIRELFDNLLGLRGGDTSAVAARVERRLSRLGEPEPGHAQTVARFLRPALDRNAGPVVAQPDALFEVLYQLLVATASTAPVVVTVDDVQWAGPETEAFLEFVSTELQHRPAPFALVVTAQAGQLAADGSEVPRKLARFDGGTVFRHTLQPLDDDAARRVIESLIHADDELAATLVARAGGNPMHLIQFVRYLTDEGLLERARGGWRARDGVDVSHLLPPSLADVMALRIEQLEQLVPGRRLRDLLNRCAVLGRSFRFRVLERMLHTENRSDLLETIDADVDLLLDEEFLRMEPMANDDVLAFPSSLVRDTLLERMKNRRTTRRLHAYAAEAKLAILGDTADKIADELVKHFGEARDRRRELEYAQIAADVAERNHRPHDAATHLRRAVSVLTDSDDPDVDASLRVALTLRLGTMRVGLGEYREAEANFIKVESEAAATARQRVLAAFGRARIHRILGEFEVAREQYESALRTARSLDDGEIVARGSLGLARVAWHAGDMDQARTLAERALALAGSTPNAAYLEPEATWLLGDVARSVGDTDRAISAFNEALEVFQANDRRAGIAKCHARLGIVYRSIGQLEPSAENYERARALYVGLGDRKGVAHQLNGLGDVARFSGEFARAADLYRRAGDIFQSLALPYDTALALANLGLVAMESGRFTEAENAFRRGAAVAEGVGYAYLSIGIGLNLAFVLAQLGRDDEAKEALERSLSLADSSELVDPDFARPLERLADTFSHSGHRQDARRMLERARSMWHDLGREEDSTRIAKQLEALVGDAER